MIAFNLLNMHRLTLVEACFKYLWAHWILQERQKIVITFSFMKDFLQPLRTMKPPTVKFFVMTLYVVFLLCRSLDKMSGTSFKKSFMLVNTIGLCKQPGLEGLISSRLSVKPTSIRNWKVNSVQILLTKKELHSSQIFPQLVHACCVTWQWFIGCLWCVTGKSITLLSSKINANNDDDRINGWLFISAPLHTLQMLHQDSQWIGCKWTSHLIKERGHRRLAARLTRAFRCLNF